MTRNWSTPPAQAALRPAFYARVVPAYITRVKAELARVLGIASTHAFSGWRFDGDFYLRESSHADSPDLLATQLAAMLDPAAPIVRNHDYESVDVLTSRRSKRQFVRQVAEYFSRLANRRAVYLSRLTRLGNQVLGTEPILDSAGSPLTGAALSAAQDDLYRGGFCRLWQRQDNVYDSADFDPPTDIPSDLAGARDHLAELIDSAAEDQLVWISDAANTRDPRPANVDQEASFCRVERLRQEAMREMRAASTVAEAESAVRRRKSVISGVTPANAPFILSSSRATLVGAARGVLALEWAAPTQGIWSYRFLVQRRSLETSDGRVVMDPVDSPSLAVSLARPRDIDDNLIVDVSFRANPPSSGTAVLPMTFRNAIGPRSITLSVAVPEASG